MLYTVTCSQNSDDFIDKYMAPKWVNPYRYHQRFLSPILSYHSPPTWICAKREILILVIENYLTNCFKYSHGYINAPFYETFAYALRDSGRIQVTHIFKKNWVRSSRLDVFYKKGVPRNLAKITGKHLCQSLFLIKLQT